MLAGINEAFGLSWLEKKIWYSSISLFLESSEEERNRAGTSSYLPHPP